MRFGIGSRCGVLATILLLLSGGADAAISYIGSAGGRADIPDDGTDGALVIARPAGVTPGTALIASIAARPRAVTGGTCNPSSPAPSGSTVTCGTVWTPPAGWIQMTTTNQQSGGTSTQPQGMTLLTYYKVVGVSEPSSYTWLIRNTYPGHGGSAVGGILAFSGIDTSSSPIDKWAANATASSVNHTTPSITTTSGLDGQMIVTSISFLSASSFANPTTSGSLTFTERLDMSQPAAADAVGTTLQMSTAYQATAGATGTVTARASGSADTGVANILSLKPSQIDPSITMVRNGPLSAGGAGSYTLTVTNLGVRPEPGPLTIVDTLPSNVSFGSASGTGWVCSNNVPAAGQVTCTRTGVLAAGASAPTLTINVNVAAGASGVLTNTATVSGTGGDGNLSNNTAVDNFVILPSPYAYYAMDEATWSSGGSIPDSSGNSRNGTAMGSVAATGVPPGSPPGAAIPGSPGTCGAGRVPSGTTAIGVDTNIDLNNIGNAGTIAFWYASSAAWNDGNARILLDASKDISGGDSADKSFFLVKRGSGALQFSLEDSSDNDSTALSASYSFAANTWHHIAVTWDLAADQLYLYLDGDTVPVASSTTNLAATLGDLIDLYIGARTGAASTSLANYTSNTANGYIDEVRIYNRALAPLEVEAVAELTHACATTVDHYELSVPSTSLACLPSTLTVTACADATSPCTNRQTAVAGRTAALTTDRGTLSATTVTFDAQGIANASLTYPTATDGTTATITLSSEFQAAVNSRKCCPDGVSCAVANSCATTFRTAGFIFSAAADGAEATFANQVAGVAFGPYWLRAVRTNTTTKACEAALTSPHPVTFGYQCVNPSACSAGSQLLVGSNSVAAAGTSVNVSFDANGNASLGNLNYLDVGQISLTASANAGGATLSGTSKGTSGSTLIVKPYSFLLNSVRQTAAPNTLNPGATDATGSRFVRAGEDFTATATAVNATCGSSLGSYVALADIPSTCISANYGRETAAETVRLNSVGGPGVNNNPTLANAAAFTGFTAGSSTVSSLNWAEVGVLLLTPVVGDGDYLGAGAAAAQTTRAVGRFFPDHFDVTITPQCTGFAYSGQPFAVRATAKNAKLPSAVTTNYQYNADATRSYARAVDLSLTAGAAAGGLFVGATPGGSGAVPSTAFMAGVADVLTTSAAPVSYAFTTFPTVATAISVHAEDVDSASGSRFVAATDGSIALPGGVRAGRLWLGNAYGSELLPLAVPVRLQYWTATGWVGNTLDGCTTLTLPMQANSGLTNALSSKTTASRSAPPVSGDPRLALTAPGAGNAGLVDIQGNVLRGTSTWLNLPVPFSRACFGACGPRSPVIYLRERF